MKENNILTELKEGWRKLGFETKKTKKLDLEFFEDIFSKTYSLLLEHSSESSVDKSYISLIAEAFLFSNIDSAALDNKCIAAFVLTERMLNNCAFQSSPSTPETSKIYVFEARKDVYINFKDVKEALGELEKILEDNYWKSL